MDNEDRLKRRMEEYISSTKDDRDVEKQERIEIQTFYDSSEVRETFERYDRPLYHMYKFYAAQDS